MKFEKKFQNMVDKSLHDQFGNDKFLHELKKMQAENNSAPKQVKSKRRYSRRFVGMVASFCIIAIVGITLSCVFLIDYEKPFPGYLFENIVSYQSDKEAFNNVSEKLALKNETWYITRCIDSVSNDELYYDAIFNLENSADALQIRLVTNKNYYYHWNGTPNRTGNWKGYEFQYHEQVKYDVQTKVYQYFCSGVINTGTQKLYLEYEYVSLTDENPFLSFLDEELELKIN